MPKVVKKEEKRRQIAKSTCGLFIEKGFVNISISEIAKVAGIGKGTVYEYFKNKEDIVFELMSCLQDDYDPKLQENLKEAKNVVQKILYLFDIFLGDDETIKIQRQIYKEFLAISMNNPSEEILVYQENLKSKYTKVISDILESEIQSKNLKEEAIHFAPSLYATFHGYFISGEDKEVIIKYVNDLFGLLELK
jgi:AcrR family transcriptional regulator